MTYTIWEPQIFYLMKRKRKKDLQVNLWDFSRQSDDMMSGFWFAFIKFSRQDLKNLHSTPRIFLFRKGTENQFISQQEQTNMADDSKISVDLV